MHGHDDRMSRLRLGLLTPRWSKCLHRGGERICNNGGVKDDEKDSIKEKETILIQGSEGATATTARRGRSRCHEVGERGDESLVIDDLL